MDASKEFYAGLKGETDPERKRKFIGGAFIDAFEAEVSSSTPTHLSAPNTLVLTSYRLKSSRRRPVPRRAARLSGSCKAHCK